VAVVRVGQLEATMALLAATLYLVDTQQLLLVVDLVQMVAIQMAVMVVLVVVQLALELLVLAHLVRVMRVA
tara:strand:- start:1219 stop:1431 length:213 start_codon:yes stop_codon:yes gene_type:complete